MKRCPVCNQVFGDENFFCLNDEIALETFQMSSPFQDTPTQILPSFPTKIVPQKTKNKGFYWLIGIMSLVIVALASVIYGLILKPQASNSQNKEKSENTEKIIDSTDAKAGNQKPSSSENKEAVPQSISPITTEAVRNLIDRWEKAQDGRNYNAYKACYAPQFFGIKRTKSGRETRMNYARWLNDRQKMLKNTIDVSVQNLEISITGDTANASFFQQFQSVSYHDEGQKILKIKMFEGGAKIIYEELKYAY